MNCLNSGFSFWIGKILAEITVGCIVFLLVALGLLIFLSVMRKR